MGARIGAILAIVACACAGICHPPDGNRSSLLRVTLMAPCSRRDLHLVGTEFRRHCLLELLVAHVQGIVTSGTDTQADSVRASKGAASMADTARNAWCMAVLLQRKLGADGAGRPQPALCSFVAIRRAGLDVTNL